MGNAVASTRRSKGEHLGKLKEKIQALPKFVQICIVFICVSISIGTLSFLALLGIVLYGSEDVMRNEPKTMIILGCQVMESGPSSSLADRLDKALAYLGEFPDLEIIVSGGQGDNEPTTEAFAMAQYLIDRGADPERIYQEGNSRNTHQNLSFSRLIMEEEGLSEDVVIVSSGFHLTRASFLWERVGGDGDNLSVLAAEVTDLPSFIKSHFREPLALVKSFLFDQGRVELIV